MNKNFILSATMAAKSEMNLIIQDFTKQLNDRLNALFKEPDAKWIDRIMVFTFENEKTTNPQIDGSLKDTLLIAAQQAKLMMYLQGIEIKKQLEALSENNHKKCLGRTISQAVDTPDYLNSVDLDQFKSK
ncbi:MAG: hypothetical protein PF503_25960 [Desulfobacula sp.]|jgi:hypothetical protein|nr:hypothetical protein [Desulfobacula sp.]